MHYLPITNLKPINQLTYLTEKVYYHIERSTTQMVNELYLDYYLRNPSNHYLTYELISEERREEGKKG